MDLRSDKPYTIMRHGLTQSYPSLHQSIHTDVVVLGAGITGALVAWHLAKKGIETVVVDRRHAGMGSTAASTALLQYEIDTPLHKLIKMVGEKNAALSYLLCRQSIYDIRDICRGLPSDAAFALRPSFQFASRKKDVAGLECEYHLRKKIGINLHWLNAAAVESTFGIEKPAGLLSEDGAEVDPYILTHALLKDSCRKGARVFDNTNAVDIQYKKNQVKIETEWGYTISARRLIIACGYESQRYLRRRIEQVQSTYAVISEPLPDGELWFRNALIWETATPYCYLRTTDDHRIIIGGKDDAFYNPAKRDASIHRKRIQLENTFHKLFPHIPFRTDFSWAGTFSGTKDGLPYIGAVRECPRTWFALGFGGNGITFSLIAAQIITDLLTGKKNPYINLFSFNR